jgi:hypothetical protein
MTSQPMPPARPGIDITAIMPSHLTPGCTCIHAPGHPCDRTCPVHTPAQLAGRRAAADVLTRGAGADYLGI